MRVLSWHLLCLVKKCQHLSEFSIQSVESETLGDRLQDLIGQPSQLPMIPQQPLIPIQSHWWLGQLLRNGIFLEEIDHWQNDFLPSQARVFTTVDLHDGCLHWFGIIWSGCDAVIGHHIHWQHICWTAQWSFNDFQYSRPYWDYKWPSHIEFIHESWRGLPPTSSIHDWS